MVVPFVERIGIGLGAMPVEDESPDLGTVAA